MIEKSFHPSAKLFFRASREIVGGTIQVKILNTLAIVLPIGAASLSIFCGIQLSGAVWGGIAGLSIYTFFCSPLFEYLSIKRNLASNPSSNQTLGYTFSKHGLRNFGNGIDVNLEWKNITKIKKTRHFVLFFISRNVAYFIPKEMLSPTELEEIHQWYSVQSD